MTAFMWVVIATILKLSQHQYSSEYKHGIHNKPVTPEDLDVFTWLPYQDDFIVVDVNNHRIDQQFDRVVCKNGSGNSYRFSLFYQNQVRLPITFNPYIHTY